MDGLLFINEFMEVLKRQSKILDYEVIIGPNRMDLVVELFKFIWTEKENSTTKRLITIKLTKARVNYPKPIQISFT